MSTLPEDFYERIKPRLRRRIGEELRLAARVLDLGCGNCELAEYLAEAYDQEVLGVDLKDPASPERPALVSGAVDCVQADAARLGFLHGGQVDAVVSVWALHEMARPERALREARRVLRPGGEILVVDFPRNSLARRLWNEGYYTVGEVRDLLRGASFDRVRARTIERRQIIWATGVRTRSGRGRGRAPRAPARATGRREA